MINYSIIIPHYNIPDLLIRCIKSIPIREDIQIIVIDDCSPGADKYFIYYPLLSRLNFEFYSTSRGGSAGRARNVGIDHAKGKWLMFVDADDLLPNNIDRIFDQYVNYKEDLIILDYDSVMSSDLSIKSERNPVYHKIISKYLNDHDDSRLRYNYDPMWGKLVKKSLVDNYKIRFDETRWSNDSYFALCCGIYAKDLVVDNKIGYILTQREGSLAGNFCGTLTEIHTRLEVALRMRKKLAKHKLPTKYAPVGYFNYILNKNFSSKQRLFLALKLWRYPEYAMHLILYSMFH